MKESKLMGLFDLVEVWIQFCAKAGTQIAPDRYSHDQTRAQAQQKCHLYLHVQEGSSKHCCAAMTCTLNEVQLALRRVKPFTSSGRTGDFPWGAGRLCLFPLSSSHEKEGRFSCWLAPLLHSNTQSHLRRGEKIKCLNHSSRVREKVKPAYFWVLRCRSDAAIFNSWWLSGL